MRGNRQHWAWAVAAIVATSPAAPVVAQQLPPAVEFGNLEYPARGNIQLDEGTIDLWVISNFDTDVKELDASGQDRRQATLFMLTFPDEKWHYPLYFIAWANGYALVGYNDPGQPYVWMGPPRWKPGEAHHVVVTWSGRKRSLFIDGNCRWVGGKGEYIAKDVDVGGPISGDLTSALIQVGRTHGFVTLDEIQIRNIALTPEQIAAAKDAPLVADEHTLLLDRCDGGPAEVIAGHSGETGGTLTGKFKIVDGKFGKAVQLWAEKAATP